MEELWQKPKEKKKNSESSSIPPEGRGEEVNVALKGSFAKLKNRGQL